MGLCERSTRGPPRDPEERDFFFFIFKKNKNFKNICPFWIISKIPPGRPPIGRQALSVIFFLQICNEVPGKKEGLSPPNGRQGPVARWGGDRVPPPKSWPPSPLSFQPKIQEKSWSACRVVTSFWNGGRALLLGHVCLGKECDIWETRDRRAE